MLLEARETAAERVAPGIDNARVRQHEMNETDVQAVVRHLVDEERGIHLAKNPGAIQIALTQGPQLRARQCRHGLKEAGLLLGSVAAGEPARGRPRMKIGSGAVIPEPARAAKNSLVNSAFERRTKSALCSAL